MRSIFVVERNDRAPFFVAGLGEVLGIGWPNAEEAVAFISRVMGIHSKDYHVDHLVEGGLGPMMPPTPTQPN